jgi:flagellar biosynthesis protein
MANQKGKDILQRCALALQLDEENGLAPKVTATARGHLVEQMLKIAEEHDIPIREDDYLAEGLQFLEVGQHVPEQFFPLLAELLFHVDHIAKKLSNND